MRRIALLAGVAIASIAAGLAEFDSAFPASLDHPAIEYTARPVNNSVAKLNRKILEGKIHLNFESSYGYLRSTLEALNIRDRIPVSRVFENQPPGGTYLTSDPAYLFSSTIR